MIDRGKFYIQTQLTWIIMKDYYYYYNAESDMPGYKGYEDIKINWY